MKKTEHAEVTHVTAREVFRVRHSYVRATTLGALQEAHDNIPEWIRACDLKRDDQLSVPNVSYRNPTCQTCAVLLDEARENAEEHND
jgi:hypothetical protein